MAWQYHAAEGLFLRCVTVEHWHALLVPSGGAWQMQLPAWRVMFVVQGVERGCVEESSAADRTAALGRLILSHCRIVVSALVGRRQTVVYCVRWITHHTRFILFSPASASRPGVRSAARPFGSISLLSKLLRTILCCSSSSARVAQRSLFFKSISLLQRIRRFLVLASRMLLPRFRSVRKRCTRCALLSMKQEARSKNSLSGHRHCRDESLISSMVNRVNSTQLIVQLL